MLELTRAEEQIMQILWDLNGGFVKDLMEHFDEPKPAYTTVSTIIRILEKKKIVGHQAYGRTHRYIPLISREDYAAQSANNLIKNYFSGSVEELVSHFVREKNISAKELEKILKKMNEL